MLFPYRRVPRALLRPAVWRSLHESVESGSGRPEGDETLPRKVSERVRSRVKGASVEISISVQGLAESYASGRFCGRATYHRDINDLDKNWLKDAVQIHSHFTYNVLL